MRERTGPQQTDVVQGTDVPPILGALEGLRES